MSVETKDAALPAPASNPAERRAEPRTPLIAQADLADIASGVKLSARVSDLSLSGCYLDALTPLPEGSDVHLRIEFNNERLAIRAKIRFSHAGLGMGVQFNSLTGEQMQTLHNWLVLIGAKLPARVATAPVRTAPAEKNPRKVLHDLIAILKQKDVLNEGEAATLLSQL